MAMKSFLNLSPGTCIQEFLWGVYVGELFGILYKKMPKCFPEPLYQYTILPVVYDLPQTFIISSG